MKNIYSIVVFFTFLFSGMYAQQYRFTTLDASKGLSDNNVRHILKLRDGRMAITTLGNINIYNGATFQYVHSSAGSDEYHLEGYKGAYHVYEDCFHRLWLKDTQRVACFNLDNNQWEVNIDSCFHTMGITDRISDIFFDHDGFVWYVQGKTVVSPDYKCRFDFGEGLGELLDLEVEQGCLYLFFNSGEVVCYDLSLSKQVYHKKYGKPGVVDTDLSMVVWQDGCFYQLRCIQGTGRLLRFDTNNRKWTLVIDVPYDLHTITLCPEGKALVCSEPALWIVDLKTLDAKTIPSIEVDGQKQEPGQLNTVYCDDQGGIWLGTYHSGLLYFHHDRLRIKSVTDINELGDITVSHVFNSPLVDSRGWKWTCTTDGLKVDIDGSTRKYYTEDGLSNNNISSLAEDNEGNLWISTSNGITKAQIKGKNIHFECFFQSDGALYGDYYPEPASMLETGEILFHGKNGWTLIDPSKTVSRPLALTPLLVSLSVSGIPLSTYISSLDLDHTQTSLELQFSALNYAQPNHTYFRYRLLSPEMDSDTLWTQAVASSYGGEADISGLLHLSFRDLKPAKYVLEVETTNQLDKWIGNRTQINIQIRPAWWNTAWARLLYIIIGVSSIIYLFLMYRQRVRRRRREEILLMRIQNLISLVNEQSQRTKAVEKDEIEEIQDLDSDDPFIRQAIELIEQNISTPGYTVEQLSRDLCMERTGLYKKISSLLDKSPSAFIKSIRLNRAVELIKTTDLTITEIAESTGFYSASHLGRSIQSQYGCKPTDLRKQTGH